MPGFASLPVAATTSVPDSCSARRLSISAGVGAMFAETLTICTSPMLRNHANAAIRFREIVSVSQLPAIAIRAIARPTSGATPWTPRSGRSAPIRLATSVP